MLVFAVFYILGGCLWNRRKGLSGKEAFPHFEFWVSVPALFCAGIKFLTRGCKKESGIGGQYDNL